MGKVNEIIKRLNMDYNRSSDSVYNLVYKCLEADKCRERTSPLVATGHLLNRSTSIVTLTDFQDTLVYNQQLH